MLFRQRGQSLVVHTPAKLNLFLEVLAKRTDGFHELETVMVSVGLYDTLTFADDPSGAVSLHCLRSDLGNGMQNAAETQNLEHDNLVLQAANLLRESTGSTHGVSIRLLKRIPVAAGLAGGSSDAAATLVALNRLWNLGLSTHDLHHLASQLGSDLNFFLSPSPLAICRGRGEQVEPVSTPLSLHFVITRPQTGLSTASVFRHCRPANAPRQATPFVACLQEGRLGGAAHHLHNALQPPAEMLNPEVRQLKARFSELPVLGHMMSGSGTAYFGMCASRNQAQLVAARLKATRTGSVFVAQSRT